MIKPSPSTVLQQLDEAGLLRRLRPLASGGGTQVTREGRSLANFSSNDYLGLSQHPALAAAWIEGIHRYGVGAGASRAVSGSLPPHQALETTIAEAKQTEAALSFSSGYATAIGAIPAIVGRGDFVVLDKLSHASLVDATRLATATLRVFPHNDVSALARILEQIRAKHATCQILVVTESVFSMDGDCCPLEAILDTCEAHEAALMLDEAHGFGILGPRGMGLAEQLGVQNRVSFQLGTFSKAAGLAGAYLASSQAWIDVLINRARSFIYSTAPPPALAAAAAASVQLIRSEEGDQLRKTLNGHIRQFDGANTPIIPVIMGDNHGAIQAAAELEAQGFLVPAIRFPTVPRGSARLRISLSAAHTDSEITGLRDALATLVP